MLAAVVTTGPSMGECSMTTMSTLKSMQSAALAIGSAAKYIGAANLELAKVAAPALGAVALSIPKRFGNKLEEARTAETPKERHHAASVFGVGVAIAAGLTVATVAHFVSKRRKTRALKEQKRRIAAAMKREKAIDRALSQAVAMRPASSLVNKGAGEELDFAKACGCYAILTYDPDVAMDDPSAYRDVFVGAADSMLDNVRDQLDGKGNLYVHADMAYGLPMYVAFFPCEKDDLSAKKTQLVDVLGAAASYNAVADAARGEGE